MQKEIIMVPADGVDLYCEKRGYGPLLIIVPDGCNDCELYAKLADQLAEDFTVISFDMRGGTRSMPKEHKMVTPVLLAQDVVAIIHHMDMGKASLYGCSSGGQTVLALGLHHPELVSNIIAHEAALLSDTQILGTGYEHFKVAAEAFGSKCKGFSPTEIFFNVDFCVADTVDEEAHKRYVANMRYWVKYYFKSVGQDSYSKEDLIRIQNLEFTVGVWSPSWMTYANIKTADRGGKPYTWLPCGHAPHVSCTELLANHIRNTYRKYSRI